ncbi:GTP cyclohydrolase [Providencia phage PSTCR4]|uniref:GTP cyclohydrolase I n=1 Tax=Providencia phage PSTCR4 TaxID=2783546 RepID=A0A873WT87_9CAUD|nr:GTP cyclohydrolase [Providencia phage PSTCR4]QPB12064.1 GTP cyclohydrolase I type 1 [Providencia phage PSTCR4]
MNVNDVIVGKIYISSLGKRVKVCEIDNRLSVDKCNPKLSIVRHVNIFDRSDVQSTQMDVFIHKFYPLETFQQIEVKIGQVWRNMETQKLASVLAISGNLVVMQYQRSGLSFYIDKDVLRSYYAFIHNGTPAILNLEDKDNIKQLELDLENTENAKLSLSNHIKGILEYIEPYTYDRAGLAETPQRVEKAINHWFGGYTIDPKDIFKTFEDGAEGSDQMVTVHNIPLYSKCEHHMADIIGHATVAYIPNGRIVGLSKINRVVDMFARRLQVQERLTNQIADCIVEHLQPFGVGVFVSARHMCMESRGVCQHGHYTTTVALRGVIRDEPETRNEFMSICK